MQSASAAFHAATIADPRSRLLMRFADGTIFTGEDVTGIDVTYPLNEETELTVGKCVSAELKTTVLNYSGLLNGFGFGECEVSLGALVSTHSRTAPSAKVSIQYDGATYAANAAAPFLTVDGEAASVQPSFSPDCLIVVDGVLYCATSENAWVADIGDTGTLTLATPVSEFMANKLSRWVGRGIVFDGGAGYEYTQDSVLEWEYVPLGTFYIDTPEKRRVATIECGALDAMQKFNADCDDWWAGLTWPMTRGEIVSSLCAWAGGALKTPTFPGSSISVESAPMAANGMVGKDILGWIAETAGAYARISRDGKLELVWFTEQNITLTRNQHFGDAPAEYTTPAVDALHVMVASSDLGVSLPEGGGENEYQVLDNPFLYGATEEEIRSKANDLYTKIISFPAYTPNAVESICDWTIEPGDIIQVVGGDGETRTLPIFRYTLSWNGGFAKASYECTGGTGRKPEPESKRREFAAYRAYHKLEVNIDGIRSEIGDIAGNVATLEVTASELKTQIAGKLDGYDAQSMIDQTVGKITLEVSSNGVGSTFTLKKDGVAISSETVDLHVKSVNVDGTITADAINLNTATITGQLSAAYIDVDSLTVKNANIESLYASKIIGGNIGGYLPSGAISDSGHYLDALNVSDLTMNSASCGLSFRVGGAGSYVTMNGAKVTLVSGGATTEKTWSEIFAGSTTGAVFG